MASWGRHGWPRKHEGARIYRERDGSYLMLFPESGDGGRYGYDAVANALVGPGTSLGSCTVARNYTYERGCKRVQWSELPAEWQQAFRRWIDVAPETIHGLWLKGQQPPVPSGIDTVTATSSTED
jgi:hypothetical protein